ncbi:4'-phosphopantetheinyl transferase family protein [Citricoccus sp. GCM10030269]|uniref:4'-phosphopantetheinyl transferase family protein n=1 Tax=Citricoccus sp. GCM10030269 TaxID=3273388 RepID=UPI003622907D
MTAPAADPTWHVVVTGPRAGDQRREALDYLAVSWGHRPGTFTVTHRCPQCGAEDHGAPELRYTSTARRRRVRTTDSTSGAPDPLPAVSFSRSHGWLATAWVDGVSASQGWRIGVDVEDPAAAAFRTAEDLGAVAFAPDEAATIDRLPASEQPLARARLWCLKEAVVKARGTGFDTDPATVRTGLAGHPEAIVVASEDWPGGPVGEGLIGVLVVLKAGV